jgi:pSer/pThr/pTyr-binding forkhead associated (FHA) protein
MTVTLVTFSKQGVRKDFPLNGGTTLIGRKTDADLRIPLGEVSRSHCQLAVNEKKVVLLDLDSSNGTFVNDQKIAQATLKPGDLIRVGPVTFTVQIDGEPAKVTPPVQRAAAAKASIPADSPTEIGDDEVIEVDEDEIDIDAMEELDLDDVSDLDLDDLDIDDDELEELDDSDLVLDDDAEEEN